MDPFYLELRAVHIGAVIASGLLLLVRALSRNLLGALWVLSWPVRLLSWTIDMVLLTAAMMLTTIVHQYPFVDNWLTIKLLLLIVYIMLGFWALRSSSAPARWASFAGAAVVFAFIISVARSHNPLGVFA